MRKTTVTLAFLMVCALASMAQKKENTSTWAFKFQDYSVTEVFSSKAAPPVLRTKDQRAYRTRIREGAAKGPNFAGHYTVAGWGCGAGCVSAVLVDARTGHLYDLPFSHLAIPVPDAGGREPQGLVYKASSRLLIADGCPNEENCGTYYYEWKDDHFKLLRSDPQSGTAK